MGKTMSDAEKLTGPMRFEPHNLAGKMLHGEMMPFGYISTSPTPVPVFELNTLLGFDADELTKFAYRLAAANNLLAALKEFDAAISESGLYETAPQRHPVRKALIAARAAIAAAEPPAPANVGE